MKKLLIFLFFVFFNLDSSNDTSSSAEEMYFCAASDSNYFKWLLNLIGSIHRVNFNEIKEIAVFDLGLTKENRNLLNSIKKVKVYDVEMTHPDLLKYFYIFKNGGKKVRGWYAWKSVIIKQALEKFPYILYLDAGCCVMKPLNNLFNYIKEKDYFLIKRNVDSNFDGFKQIHFSIKHHSTKYMINKFLNNASEKNHILNSPIMLSSIMGFSRSMYKSFILPIYQLTKNLKNFQDNGPKNFGSHDQAIYSIYAYKHKLRLFPSHEKVKIKNLDSNFEFCISKYRNNDPDIQWHYKDLLFKKYIRYKE